MDTTGTRTTKWSYLTEQAAALEAQAAAIRAQLQGMDETLFGYRCTGCGELLATEGDFARHYTIPDTRYLNLGDCPNKGFDFHDADGVDVRPGKVDTITTHQEGR